MSGAPAWSRPSRLWDILKASRSSISTSATTSVTAWSSASLKPTTNALQTSLRQPVARRAPAARAIPSTKIAATNPIPMILNRQRSVRVSVRELDKFLARALLHLHIPAGSLTVCLVDNKEMARWNLAYRGKKGATDVLSFPTDGPERNGTSRAAHSRPKPGPKPAPAG